MSIDSLAINSHEKELVPKSDVHPLGQKYNNNNNNNKVGLAASQNRDPVIDSCRVDSLPTWSGCLNPFTFAFCAEEREREFASYRN